MNPPSTKYRLRTSLWLPLSILGTFGITSAQDSSYRDTRVETQPTPVRGTTPVEGNPYAGSTGNILLDGSPGPILNDAVHGPSLADRAWRPAEYLFNPLVPRQTNLWANGTDTVSLQIQPGFPLASSIDGPGGQLPEFKFGPVYLDVINVGATGIWSDVSGDNTASLPDDGFIAALTTEFNLMVRLTSQAVFIVGGQLYYLPTEGRVGFYIYENQASFANFQYNFDVDDWHFNVYDIFQVRHRLADLLDNVEVDEIAEAGRYRLGRAENVRLNSNSYFDGDSLSFSNSAGISAYHRFNQSWSLWTGYSHNDYWLTTDFDEHARVDLFTVRMDYTKDWRWTPYVNYQASSPDGWGSYLQSVMGGIRGSLTQRFDFDVSGGYLWADGESNGPDFERDDSILWTAGLLFRQSDYVQHSLYAGQTHMYSDIGNGLVANMQRYSINFRLPINICGNYLRGANFGAYAQHADADWDYRDEGNSEIWQYGANVDIPLGDRTNLVIGYALSESRAETTVQDIDRWFAHVTLTRQLGNKTNLSATYQREHISQLNGNLDEDLVMLQITRFF
jgi:hypothetical protein